jgi:hypothetical protein
MPPKHFLLKNLYERTSAIPEYLRLNFKTPGDIYRRDAHIPPFSSAGLVVSRINVSNDRRIPRGRITC